MARVLIVGTGGVGGYFGAALAEAGHDVVFVARGANLEALRAGGLRVGGARSITIPEVRATDTPAEAGERDLVLLCVKSYDLEEAAAPATVCGGVALTLQNGVDAAERVRPIWGDEVLAGTTNIVADLPRPARVELVSPYARIRLGEPAGGWSDRVERVTGWLRRARDDLVQVEPLEHVMVALWEKMALICAMAGLTTLYGRSVGPILADEHAAATFRRIVEECESVASARGVPVPAGFAEDRMRWAAQIPPEATSSMSRDLRRGKRLEVDHLNGTIVRYAAELGLQVPVNQAVYAGIRLATSGR